MAFMTPLLFVAARNGSALAKAYASRIPFIMDRPSSSSPDVDNSLAVKTPLTRAKRCTAKLEMIFSTTTPLQSSPTSGPIVSHIVLTAFAPIASRQSTSKWTMSMVPASVSSTRASTSRHPPPNFTNIGSTLLAISISFVLFARMAFLATCASIFNRHTWIWPIMTGGVQSDVKPPRAWQRLAMFDAAATTDGSSSAIGTT
mmetsp:Transcript_8559/g.24340  ORF Transcript_8559/g.24340 Transcript_8559/m.24340 type:complete len:201 (-) Transcript_8559:258-860(-)